MVIFTNTLFNVDGLTRLDSQTDRFASRCGNLCHVSLTSLGTEMHDRRLLSTETGGRSDFTGRYQLLTIIESNLGPKAKAGDLDKVTIVLVVLVKLVLGPPVNDIEIEVAVVVDISKSSALGTNGCTLQLRLFSSDVNEVTGTIVHVHLVGQLAITFVEVQVALIINVTKGWTLAPAFFTGDLVTCLGKDASAIVQIEVVAADVIGNEQILITIVIDVSEAATEAPVGIVDTRSSRSFDKGAVTVIDEKFVWLTGRVTAINNIEVNITIVVDIRPDAHPAPGLIAHAG